MPNVTEQIDEITARTRRGDLIWRAASPGEQFAFVTLRDDMRMSIRSVDQDDGHPFELIISQATRSTATGYRPLASITSGSDQGVNAALSELYAECKTREASIMDALDRFLS